MFLVNWLFGKQEKKPEKPEAAVPNPTPESKVANKVSQLESALNNLDKAIKIFKEKQLNLDKEAQLHRIKTKDFLAIGDQAEARKCATIVVAHQQQSKNNSIRIKVLADQKFKLEQAMMEMETIAALNSSTELAKKQELVNEQEDASFSSQQFQEKVESKDKALEEKQEDNSIELEVDILLQELANELKKEKESKVEGEKKENIEPTNPNVGDSPSTLANL